jgi:hypothetical protein
MLSPAACTSKSCTLLACQQGVVIDIPPQTEAASYDFQVRIDGQLTTCTSTVAADGTFSSSSSCTRPDGSPVGGTTRDGDVYILGGKGGPGIRQISIASTNAKQIEVVIRKAGAIVGEKSFAPVYDETPGPNGPDCEPQTCRLATTTL